MTRITLIETGFLFSEILCFKLVYFSAYLWTDVLQEYGQNKSRIETVKVGESFLKWYWTRYFQIKWLLLSLIIVPIVYVNVIYTFGFIG